MTRVFLPEPDFIALALENRARRNAWVLCLAILIMTAAFFAGYVGKMS